MPFSIAGPASPAIPSLDGINRAADRLSSGLRTDYQLQAAEAAISGRLDTQIGESTVNIKNAINQISALQQADQTLSQGKDLTERIQELSIQSRNGALSQSDQEIISKEASNLLGELDNLLENSRFGGQPLFSEATVDVDEIREQVKTLDAADTIDQTDLKHLSEDLASLQTTLGVKQSGLSAQIQREFEARQSQISQQSRIADSDSAEDVAKLIQEQLNFEARVKAFNYQRLAESSFINLLN